MQNSKASNQTTTKRFQPYLWLGLRGVAWAIVGLGIFLFLWFQFSEPLIARAYTAIQERHLFVGLVELVFAMILPMASSYLITSVLFCGVDAAFGLWGRRGNVQQ
jgi:hypothetical protein